jgi:hypothetical protein
MDLQELGCEAWTTGLQLLKIGPGDGLL